MVDEASGVSDRIFEAIEACMTSTRARMLLIGNPTRNSGAFYEAFHSKRDLWKTMHISAFDTPNFGVPANAGRDGPQNPARSRAHAIPGLVTPTWADEVARNWGDQSPQYTIRVLGDFPSRGRNTLFSLSLIEQVVRSTRARHEGPPPPDKAGGNSAGLLPAAAARPEPAERVEGPRSVILSAAKNPVPPLPSPEGDRDPSLRPEGPRVRGDAPTVLGVDVARFGTDLTAVCVRSGDSILDFRTYSHLTTMETAGHVAEAIRTFKPSAVYVDEIGVGSGVVDRLKELGFSTVRGVNVAGKSKSPEHYANLRAELYDSLRRRLEERRISLPDNRTLIGQLASVEYTITSSGQTIIVSKEDSGGPSPDLADSLVLTLFERTPFKIWTGPPSK